MNVYYFHHQADELLGTASEQFLGKSVKEIKQTILQTLEGHLRAILGKLMAMFIMNDGPPMVSSIYLIQCVPKLLSKSLTFCRNSIRMASVTRRNQFKMHANMSYV